MSIAKQDGKKDVDWNADINVVQFMKANKVNYRVHDVPMFKWCFIEVDSPKLRGTLHFRSTLTRREAVDLLRGLGIPVVDEMAG